MSARIFWISSVDLCSLAAAAASCSFSRASRLRWRSFMPPPLATVSFHTSFTWPHATFSTSTNRIKSSHSFFKYLPRSSLTLLSSF